MDGFLIIKLHLNKKFAELIKILRKSNYLVP